MDNYANPLDHFRSYSYHFILTVANNTEAFRKLVPLGAEAGGKSAILSAVNDVFLGGEVKGVPGTYLVLDTRRFSQYNITDLDMEHVYGTGPQHNPTTPISLTKLKIIDTTGLSFFNLLMDTFRNKLKTTQGSAFFLLTVVFSGHTDTNTTEVISTCNIMLLLTTLDFEFTSSGSVFEITMMEQEAGPSPRGINQQQITNLGTVKSITTRGGPNNIAGLINSLEDRLNVQSLDHYQKFGNNPDAGGNRKVFGKLVQYMITIPPDIAAMKITNAARNKNVEQMYKTTRPQDANSTETKSAAAIESLQKTPVESQVTFAATTLIPDAIRAILETSDDFLKTASLEKRNDFTGFTIKILTSITSDESTYVIHFDVYKVPMVDTKRVQDEKKNAVATKAEINSLANRYPAPKSTVVTAGATGSTAVEEVPNLIKYDFIFTGNNSHIIGLAIKFANAAAALDTNLSIGGNRKGTNAAAGQNKDDVAKIEQPKRSSTGRVPDLAESDPIFIPMQTKEAARDVGSTKTNEALDADAADEQIRAKMEYEETYAFLHFVSNMTLDVSIRGNPNLIRKYADKQSRGGFAPHYKIIDRPSAEKLVGQQTPAQKIFDSTIRNPLASAKDRYISEFINPRIKPSLPGGDTLINGPDVATSHVFVKINIQAPNTDYAGNSLAGQTIGGGQPETQFTDKFFYNGVYRLLKMRTQFSGGSFKHDMQLIPDLDKPKE